MPDPLDPALATLLRDPLLALWPFGAVLASTIAVRLNAGATLGELWRTRFHEVIPARAVVWIVLATLWAGFGVAIVVAVGAGRRVQATKEAHGTWDGPQIAAIVAATVAALLLFLVRRRWSRSVVRAPAGAPPAIDCSLTPTSRGIEPRALAELGFERFPHPSGEGWRLGLWSRVTLAVALLAGGVSILGQLEALERAPPAALDLRGDLPPLLALAMAWIGASTFLLFAVADRHYLVLRFAPRLLLLLGCAAVATAGASAIRGPEGALVVAGLACLVGSWRMIADLRLARRHVVQRRAAGPIEAALARAAPYLDQLQGDAGCALPELDLHEREQRVSQGADNLTEAGTLVARRFGRFLRVGALDSVRCDAAFLRFLTVDRWVVSLAGSPTTLPLCDPKVPVWNESLFPIHPPKGFTSLDDRLALAARWNLVSSCMPCNGTGEVEADEQTTEHRDGRAEQVTRRVRRPCTTCNGYGRLEHPRVLVTAWRRFLPGHVLPHLGTHELVEDAIEAIIMHRPIVEDRETVAAEVTCTIRDQQLAARACAAAEQVVSGFVALAEHAKRAAGGTVYRADFLVGAFHTVRIHFGIRVGWFFGARPEFHFPRLPLAWSLLATVWTLPLALWWCATRLQALAQAR